MMALLEYSESHSGSSSTARLQALAELDLISRRLGHHQIAIGRRSVPFQKAEKRCLRAISQPKDDIQLTGFHSDFFANLLEEASDRANQIVSRQASVAALLERTISDFELSPLLDRQLAATALRLAKDLPSPSDIRQRLLACFRGPAPAATIDSQRREIEREVRLRGIPMELSSDYVQTLE